DVEHLRCMLDALPQASIELVKIGNAFQQRRVLARGDATESALLQLDKSGELRRASVILFATHAFAPGELDLINDPMRIGRSEFIGVPTTGQSALDFLRRSTKLTNNTIAQFNDALIFNLYKRDVPDKRFISEPGLVLSLPSPQSVSGSEDDGFLSTS